MPSKPIPDLNTDNTSFLAHYQVTDKDGTFEPEQIQFETESSARFQPQSTDVYDNGIEMKVDDTFTNNTITLRGGNENHNWVTAHLKDYTSENGGAFTQDGTDITDVSNFSYTGNKSNLEGEYGLMPWGHYKKGYDSSQNSLFDVIQKSLSNAGFWNRSSLKLENSGIYNYSVSKENPSIENQKTSIFGSNRDRGENGKTYGFSYTDSTTIHRAYLAGSFETITDYNLDLKINGRKVYQVEDGKKYYFAHNITNIVDNQKQFEVSYILNREQNYEGISLYCIVVWS